MLSSIKNFALAFVITLVIFGVSAYFLVGFIENNMNNVLKPDDSGNEQTDEIPEGEEETVTAESDGLPDTLTFLLCGLDSGASQRNEKPETDIIILMQINKVKKEFMFTALSSNFKVEYKNNVLRLGMIYSMYDIRDLIVCVKAHTAIDVDFYAVVDYKALEEIFEIVGEIEYDVGMDMYYMPEWVTDYLAALEENKEELDSEKIAAINSVLHHYDEDAKVEDKQIIPEIDLKKGVQQLDYKKALQLLRYKDYSNGDLGRGAAALNFCKEMLRQKVTFENKDQAAQIFKALKESITTNMTETDLIKNIDLLFTYSKYTVKEISYPGKLEYMYGDMFFLPNALKGINEFKDYRMEKPAK